MAVIDDVKVILGDVLQLAGKPDDFDENTALLGGLPEFDSMAVIGVITALEEQFDFDVTDDEIDADVFESVGTLVAFVDSKLNE